MNQKLIIKSLKAFMKLVKYLNFNQLVYFHFIKTNTFYHESFSFHQIDYLILLHNYHSPIIVIYLFICSASIASQLANNMLIFLKTRNTVLIKYILFMHAISLFPLFSIISHVAKQFKK